MEPQTPGQQQSTLPATPPAEPPKEPPADDKPYFVAQTKDEYERAFGPTRQEGRDALLKKLGFEKPTELENFVNEYREVQDAAKGETEREKEAREAAEKARDAANQTLNQERINFRLESALRDAGVPSERIADALALASREGLEFNDKGELPGLAAAVTATLEPRPWLKAGQQQTYTAPDATPPTPQGLDLANMTDEEIQKLADRVTRGETIPIIQ